MTASTFSPFRLFTVSPSHRFAFSPFRRFAFSPLRPFAYSPFRLFAPSPLRPFALSPIFLFPLFFLAVFAAPACRAQPPSVAQAGTMYKEGKFVEAAQAYAELSASDPDNPYLHYNLGNAYFRANRLGRAVASYSRAFRLLPRDPDIRYNLNFAMKRAGEELVPAGVPSALHRAYHLLSEAELKGLCWALLWLMLLGSSLYALARNMRPALKTHLASAAGLLCALSLWLAARSFTSLSGAAVIVDGTAELRSGPGDNFSPSATVPEGRTVQVLDSNEGWEEVGLPREGIKGWVKSSSVEKI